MFQSLWNHYSSTEELGFPQCLDIDADLTPVSDFSQLYLEYHLKPTWDWLITVMDSTEAQLRFGAALSETTDPSHPSHPMHSSYVRTLRERATREDQRMLQSIDSSRRRTRTGEAGCPSEIAVQSAPQMCFALSLLKKVSLRRQSSVTVSLFPLQVRMATPHAATSWSMHCP